MASRGKYALLVLWSFVFAMTLAQTNNTSLGNDACGDDITYRSEFFTIRWNPYCNSKMTTNVTASPIKRTSFGDCSVACIEEGTSCAGFAFDRTSHFSENNCYLSAPSDSGFSHSTAVINPYFDSAIVATDSTPLTNRQCDQTGSNGTYNDMDLHCGYGIHDQGVAGQSQNQINSNFASSLSDCIDLCRNCNYTNGCEVPCQAVSWDYSLTHGYKNCVMRSRGYVAPVADLIYDSATLVGTSGIVIPDTNSTTNSTNTANSPSRSSKGLSHATIVGIAVGCVVGVIGVLLVIFFVWRHARKSRQEHADRPPAVRDVVGTRPELAETPIPVVAGPSGIKRPIDAKGKGRAIEETAEMYSGGSGSGSGSVSEIAGRTRHELFAGGVAGGDAKGSMMNERARWG